MEFTDLLTGLRNRSGEALDFFLREYSSLIKTHIRRHVHPNDVDDAVQEFLYHILKTNLFSRFTGEGEVVFMAFLLRCALNFALNWRKREFNLNKALESFDADNPNHWKVIDENDPVSAAFNRQEISSRLNEAIQNLDIQYRSVIELKLLDYAISEIAQILDEPLGSVNSLYTRGIRMLRDRLKDLHTNPDGDGLFK